ncbi:ribonuclease J, partial [Enterococcus faecalis]
PDILSRVFVYMRESGDMIHEGDRLLFNALGESMKDKNCTEAKLGEAMRTALQPLLFEQTQRHPIVLPKIMTATVSDQ